MKRIRENFLKLPKLLDDKIKIVDASQPLKNVFEDVNKDINNILA